MRIWPKENLLKKYDELWIDDDIILYVIYYVRTSQA